jgi:predicted Holliday junction resolvase-like endonuclease
MIVVVMIVCITIIIKGIFSIHRNQKQLKELENRLDEHYKEREQRILNSMRNNMNHMNTNRNKIRNKINVKAESKGVIKRGNEWPE